MKKLSERHRRILIYRHHQAMKNRGKRNLFRSPTTVLFGDAVSVTLTTKSNREDAFGYRLTPPEVFCFEKNLSETIKFLDNFRKVILSRQRLRPRKKTEINITIKDGLEVLQISPQSMKSHLLPPSFLPLNTTESNAKTLE